MLSRLLWQGEHGLLRTPWRILLFLSACIVALYVVQGLLYPITTLAGSLFGVSIIAYPWALVLSLLVAHYAVLRKVERLSWSDAGLGRGAANHKLLARAWVLGLLAIGVPSLLLLAGGWLSVAETQAGSWFALALRSLIVLLPAAFAEELLMRGYLFTALRQGWGWKSAIVVTSLAFGLLHATNPGADVRSIGVVIIAGFFLGGILLATGSLLAATVAHLAWNWTIVAVLHSPVSGYQFETPGYRVISTGPEWLTGGNWGPEGGLAAVLGMIVAMLYLSVLGRKRWPWAYPPAREERAPMDVLRSSVNKVNRPSGREGS